MKTGQNVHLAKMFRPNGQNVQAKMFMSLATEQGGPTGSVGQMGSGKQW